MPISVGSRWRWLVLTCALPAFAHAADSPPIVANAKELHAALTDARPGATIRVDLPAQTVTGPDGAIYPFRIDAFRKKCLLEGLDDVGITLQHEAAIAAFETQYRKRFDWLFHGNV